MGMIDEAEWVYGVLAYGVDAEGTSIRVLKGFGQAYWRLALW